VLPNGAFEWPSGGESQLTRVGTQKAHGVAVRQASAGFMKTLRITFLAFAILALSVMQVKAIIGGPEILIVVPPLPQVALTGLDVTFSVIATGPGALTYQWRHGTTPIPGATNSTLTLPNVQIRDAGIYVVKVSRGTQGIDSLPALLTVAGISVQDLTEPVLKIASPQDSFVRSAVDSITLTGAASDDVGLASISYQHNGGSWLPMVVANDWSFNSPLYPGTNEFLFQAVDLVGNVSAIQRVVIFHVVTQPLDLAISGEGAVSGATNRQWLEIGRSYSLVATPKPGNYFSNWVANGVVVSGQTLNFLMQSNTVIQANFVANSFLGLQGTYSGLFYDPSIPVHESSGFLTFKVTDKGGFSGKVILAGTSYSLSGQFGLDLHAQQTVNRALPNLPIVVDLQLASGSHQVTGSINNGIQTVPLDGYRSTFHATLNPATNFAGKFSMIFSGGSDLATYPFGYGCGVIAINTAGGVQFKGVLAEGSPFTAKAPLAANGQWAFYVPLYRGRGSLFGWMTLAKSSTNDVQGLFLWTKPGIAGAFYACGFTNELTAQGSRYTVPGYGVPVLSLSNAVVLLKGGNLVSPMTNDVVLTPLNKVIFVSTNTQKLALTLSTSSGLISGSFINPQTLKKSSIKGVILQKQNAGAGFFLGTNQSGSVFLGLP
jgi:Immunoglobulin domain/Divergent InlB B-repeat domain/Bacterial Ig domain